MLLWCVVLAGDHLPSFTGVLAGRSKWARQSYILEICLVTGQFRKPALIRSFLRVLKEVIVMLVHWFIVVTRWLRVQKVNLRLLTWLKQYKRVRREPRRQLQLRAPKAQTPSPFL